MSAPKAHSWARTYHRELTGADSPAAGPYSGPELAHVVRGRLEGSGDYAEVTLPVLARTWIEVLNVGYCAAEIRAVEDEFAILIDSGLIRTVQAAAGVVAHHFRAGLFTPETVTGAERSALGRIYAAFVGQYFLLGRITEPFPLVSNSSDGIARHITTEALAFVVGHELAHAVAGHTSDRTSTRWLTQSAAPPELRQYAAEIEADALALQLCIGDLWGRSVAEGELQARLLAIRLTFQVMETVERCSLVAASSRHLPATRRWAGLRFALGDRVSSAWLDALDKAWASIVSCLSFSDVTELEPPRQPPLEALAASGWNALPGVLSDRWVELETWAWQFRLETVILDTLVGTAFVQPPRLEDPNLDDAYLVGKSAVDEMLSRLPAWLLDGGSTRGNATSADLIQYLRRRSRWPEPIRSDANTVMPIHLMAASLARRVNHDLAQAAELRSRGHETPAKVSFDR